MTDEALPEHLAEVLARLPESPGVYLMKDKRGRVVYVGKAASLRQRVRAYFTKSSSDTRYFVPLLAGLLSDIETVVTNSEKEALLLENTLIKQHQPRFNAKLTDDKNFIVLRLDPRQKWPRLEVRRRLGDDGAYYFGPYHSATAARETLRVVNRHFKLRTCTDFVLKSRRRPCLQYQIKRCDAPCVLPVAEAQYGEDVRDVALFLQGKDDEVLVRLGGRMREAAKALEFERAGAVRDQIAALEATLERQRVVSSTFTDQDAVGLFREGPEVEIAVLFVRKGKLVGRQTCSLRQQEMPDVEVLSSFVDLHYDLAAFVPDEVLLPLSLDDLPVKAEVLRDKKGAKVDVLAPQRGPRAELVRLAQKNAESTYKSRRDHERDAEESLAKMQRRLRLPRPPNRIECYDIANLHGSAIVASMVVFEGGLPKKSAYRRFQIKSVTGTPDDFASIYEVLSRRFKRAKDASPGWELPDLIVVDGGRGQLGAALAAARDQGVDAGPQGLAIVGLAKERQAEVAAEGEGKYGGGGGTGDRRQETGDRKQEMREGGAEAEGSPSPSPSPSPKKGKKAEGAKRPDRVFLPRIKDPIPLRDSSAEMFVLARIRDEAHRFANAYHQLLRKQRAIRTQLALVPGIGAKRQRELLRHFGSVKKLREATAADIARVHGMNGKAAEAVWTFLHGAAEEPAADRPDEGSVEDAETAALADAGLGDEDALDVEALAEGAEGAEEGVDAEGDEAGDDGVPPE